MTWLVVATGGALNLIGSMCIGVLAGLIASGHINMIANARAFVFVDDGHLVGVR